MYFPALSKNALLWIHIPFKITTEEIQLYVIHFKIQNMNAISMSHSVCRLPFFIRRPVLLLFSYFIYFNLIICVSISNRITQSTECSLTFKESKNISHRFVCMMTPFPTKIDIRPFFGYTRDFSWDRYFCAITNWIFDQNIYNRSE